MNPAAGVSASVPMNDDIHLVVGPREYIGLQAQGIIACGIRRAPMMQRTRDAANATCPTCRTPAVVEAAEAKAFEDYHARLGGQAGSRR